MRLSSPSTPDPSSFKPNRFVLWSIIVMTILLLFGTATLVGIIVSRAHSHRSWPQAQVPTAQAVQLTRQEATLSLAPDEGFLVSQTVRPDGTVVLQLHAQDRDQLLVWNPDAHKIVAHLIFRKSHPSLRPNP